MLAVAHAGRGGRSTSSWVAGCAGLDDGYTEWVNQACRSRSVTHRGLTAPSQTGGRPDWQAPRVSTSFLHDS